MLAGFLSSTRGRFAVSTAPPTPSVIVRTTRKGEPVYAAKWRHNGRQVLRNLGPAWLDPDDAGGWVKRRGRTGNGFLDARTAPVRAAEVCAQVTAELAAADEAAQRPAVLTVRQLAHEWLDHVERVDQIKPSTSYYYRSMLAEPGMPHRRGSGHTLGLIMGRFGDTAATAVTPRQVADWLRDTVDDGSRTPRTVNAYRQILAAVFAYGMRAETHGLPSNPAAGAPRRREPPPARLDVYSREEVEQIARAVASGAWRKERSRRLENVPVQYRDAEAAARVREDARDADFLRLLFATGLRLGEALALRIDAVAFAADMSGVVLDVHRSFSAGQLSDPKSRRARTVPGPRMAAEALARVLARDEYLEPNDLVFGNRYGRRIDSSAMRRRYRGAVAATGLRKLKLHGLRHAAGSLMAQSMPLVSVRDILGHSKLATTGRYLHSQVDDAALRAINAAYGDTVPAEETVER